MKDIQFTKATQKLSGKTHNGDNCDVFTLNNQNLIVGLLADGVGGSVGDWKASDTVVERFQVLFPDLLKNHSIKASIEKTLFQINDEFLQIEGFFKGMKSTCVVLVIDVPENSYYYVGIGDSRLYLINEIGLIQLTEDEVKSVIRRKQNGNPIEIGGNVVIAKGVTNVMGISDLTFNVFKKKLPENFTFILASDGFYSNILQPEKTFTTLSQSMSLETELNGLMKVVLQHQEDDVSTVVIRGIKVLNLKEIDKILQNEPNSQNISQISEHICKELLKAIAEHSEKKCTKLLEYINKFQLSLNFNCYDKAIKSMFQFQFNHSEIYQQLVEKIKKCK